MAKIMALKPELQLCPSELVLDPQAIHSADPALVL